MKKRIFGVLVVLVTIIAAFLYFDTTAKERKECANQLIEDLHKKHDYQRMLTVADSLEKDGGLSSIEADYWCGYAADRLKQKDDAERFWRAAMELGERSSDKADLEIYTRSASRLANLLCMKRDFEGTLAIAVPAVKHIKELATEPTSDYINLLIFIGCSQAALNSKDAPKDYGFYEACRLHQENIKNHRSDAAYKDAIAGLINIAYHCVRAKKYKEALYYTSSFGELLGEYELRPEAREDYVDKQLGRYDIYKAEALYGTGHKEEAAETFQAYKETNFSKSPEGIVLAEAYHKAIGDTIK